MNRPDLKFKVEEKMLYNKTDKKDIIITVVLYIIIFAIIGIGLL